jgi:Arc/MetJ family transcription regulator
MLVCVARTNIDIDEALIQRVMVRYGLKTKREAVDFALRQVIREPMSLDEALAMEGSGWEGNLDEMRSADRPIDL